MQTRMKSRRLISYPQIKQIFGADYDTVRAWKCGARGVAIAPFPQPAKVVGQSKEWHEGDVIAWGIATWRLDPVTLEPTPNSGGRQFHPKQVPALRWYFTERARLTDDPAMQRAYGHDEDLLGRRVDLAARQATVARHDLLLRTFTRWLDDPRVMVRYEALRHARIEWTDTEAAEAA